VIAGDREIPLAHGRHVGRSNEVAIFQERRLDEPEARADPRNCLLEASRSGQVCAIV
jgi:hypothetical protein